MGGRAASQGSDLVNPDDEVWDEIRSALAAPDSGEIKARRTAIIICRSRDYRLLDNSEIDGEEKAASEME